MALGTNYATNRAKENKGIKLRMDRHKEIMDRLILEGITRDEASKIALKKLTDKKF